MSINNENAKQADDSNQRKQEIIDAMNVVGKQSFKKAIKSSLIFGVILLLLFAGAIYYAFASLFSF